MGLYGAIIVLPATSRRLHGRAAATNPGNNAAAKAHWGEADFRLAAGRLRPSQDLLRPGIPVPVGGDGSEHSQAALAQVTALDGCTAGSSGMQPQCSDRALPSGVLPDQRPLHARRHGRQLRGRVSAPALQRQSAHASGRACADSRHRPGPLAASVPRARQPRAHPGARRQPDPRAGRQPTWPGL